MTAPVLVVFGLLAPPDLPVLERALARTEQSAVQALSRRGFEVRPAPEGASRPTALDAGGAGGDVAARSRAHRVLVLDWVPRPDAASGRASPSLLQGEVWITHFIRGVRGAWDVRSVGCGATPERLLACPGWEAAVLAGLRPRTRLDVDVGAALRSRAKAVTRCVRRARTKPAKGLEIELEIPPSGKARVRSLVPPEIRQTSLGACLRQAFEAIRVGPFEGRPLSVRVPIQP